MGSKLPTSAIERSHGLMTWGVSRREEKNVHWNEKTFKTIKTYWKCAIRCDLSDLWTVKLRSRPHGPNQTPFHPLRRIVTIPEPHSQNPSVLILIGRRNHKPSSVAKHLSPSFNPIQKSHTSQSCKVPGSRSTSSDSSGVSWFREYHTKEWKGFR